MTFREYIDRYFLDPNARAAILVLQWAIVRWQFVLAIILSAIIALYILYLLLVSHGGFWDFQSYVAAVKAMENGKSPYDEAFKRSLFGDGIIGFVYPPLVAEAFFIISGVALTPVGLTVLLIATVVSTLAIPYLLADCPKNWYSPQFLYIFGFYFVFNGLGGLRLVASGNIQPILCASIVASVVAAIRLQDYKFFWIALAFCSFFKFYFLVFLLVPLILDKKYVAVVIFVLLFGALYTANYFFNPELFDLYVAHVKMYSTDQQVAGFSLYSLIIMGLKPIVANDFRVSVIALGIHFALVLLILGLAHAIAVKHTRPRSFDLFSCWIFMSAYLLSPRLLEYDIAILVVPFVRLGRMLLLKGGTGLAVAAIIGISGCIFVRTPYALWIGTIWMIGVWLGAAILWLRVNGPEAAGSATGSRTFAPPE